MHWVLSPSNPGHNCMIDVEHEKLMSLPDVAAMLPGRRRRKLALSTVWRWIKRGRKGVRLESIVIGARRYTSREAVLRWLAQLNEVESSPQRSTSRMLDTRVEGQLDALRL